MPKIAAALFARSPEAEVVSRQALSLPDWTPQARLCHDNCDIWVSRNENWRRVRGVLIFDTRQFGFIRFVAHSVVANPDGDFIDITPCDATGYPFLEYLGSIDEYRIIELASIVDHVL
ncbi:hypothetical protein D3C71_1629440 [compost metagenome]